MKLSERGLAAIKVYEGLRPEAYPDPGSSNGLPITIGYGATRKLDGSPWQLGDTITEAEAEELLRRDLQDAEHAVAQWVAVPLRQGQYDTLVSFVHNLGEGAFSDSTLLKKLNAGGYTGAADELLRWIHNDGKPMDGLKRRRQAERAMFLEAAPIERKDTMPLPAVAQFALSVAPALLKLLPWYSSGSESSERNIRAIETIAPVLLEAAKRGSGQAGAVEAVDDVMTKPEARQEFVRVMAEQWDDVRPMLEFEEASRDKARTFALQATSGQETWRSVGFGVLLASLALTIVLGGGLILYFMLKDPTTPPEQKGMILGALLGLITTVVAYFFGSSAGSKRSGDAVRAIAEHK